MEDRRVPLWFAGGEKGGVGKSTCSHLLIDYLRERCKGQLLVVETDPINPDVGRTFYDKDLDDVKLHPLKFDSVNAWIELLKLVENTPDDALLINGAAQLYESLEIGKHMIDAVGELHRQWVTWWVMGPDIDSVDILDRYVSMIGAENLSQSRSHRLIVIENAGRSKELNFTNWRGSKLYTRLMEAEISVVEVSHLATTVVDKIRTKQWSIAEARAKLKFPERVELERWRNAAFASISHALGDG